MTDPAEMDQASLERIARLQQRRRTRPSASEAASPAAETSQTASPAAGARRPARRRRPHPAAGGRVLAAGLGATTMFGLTAALALEATADTTQPEVSLPLPATAPAAAAPPVETAPPLPAEARTVEGTLPPGFTIDDIDIDSIPDGGVLTGELTDDGRPIVLVFHAPTPPAATVPAPGPAGRESSAAEPSVATAPAPAPAAPTALTATPVVTEVAVPAPAAPPATTSGS